MVWRWERDLAGRGYPLGFLYVLHLKDLAFAINSLESTLTSACASVASKGLDGGRLRLKTGKTRCLSASAHSKGLKGMAEQRDRVAGQMSELGDRGQEIGVGVRRECGDRRWAESGKPNKETATLLQSDRTI